MGIVCHAPWEKQLIVPLSFFSLSWSPFSLSSSPYLCTSGVAMPAPFTRKTEGRWVILRPREWHSWAGCANAQSEPLTHSCHLDGPQGHSSISIQTLENIGDMVLVVSRQPLALCRRGEEDVRVELCYIVWHWELIVIRARKSVHAWCTWWYSPDRMWIVKNSCPWPKKKKKKSCPYVKNAY